MFSSLLFILFTSSLTQAVPPYALTPTNQKTTNAQPSYLPQNLVNHIATFTDDKTSALMGTVSKELRFGTLERNRRTEESKRWESLMLIKEKCGSWIYWDLTANGNSLFSSNYYNYNGFFNYGGIRLFSQAKSCNHALRDGLRHINERLTYLIIIVPVGYEGDYSSELASAMDLYFESLEELIKRKSNYSRVIVRGKNPDTHYAPYRKSTIMSEGLEKRLFKILLSLSIEKLEIEIRLLNPFALINPTVSHLSLVFIGNYGSGHSFTGLSNLTSVSIPYNKHSYVPVSSFVVAKSNVKELTLPTSLVAEALSDEHSIEKLNIFATISSGDASLALMETKKALTGLTLGRGVCSSLLVMSKILHKFKSSLESLSVTLSADPEFDSVRFFRPFLYWNHVIKHISITVAVIADQLYFSHSFLAYAENLESYSYSGVKPSEDSMQTLFTFISTHTSLKTLFLRFYGSATTAEFLEFYDRFVLAVQDNQSIEKITLIRDINIDEEDFVPFMRAISLRTEPLVVRNLLINTIPVAKIVSDLAESTKDNLKAWNIRSLENQEFFHNLR